MIGMVRDILVGGTDFSTQSINEIKFELNNWINETEKTMEKIIKVRKNLNEQHDNYYNNHTSFNFKERVKESLVFYESVIETSNEILTGLDGVVKDYHVKIAQNISDNAHKLYKSYRRAWKEDRFMHRYDDSLFKEVESIYKEGSDMLGDLWDFSNLASRLKDYVGRGETTTTQVNKNFTDNSSSININNSSNVKFSGDIDNSINKRENHKVSIFPKILKFIKQLYSFKDQ